ncbi:S1 family peptidase, partial [Streptomyces sp. MBT56]|nr:S1 family peptidase [Streptomyces sp. MBT56]
MRHATLLRTGLSALLVIGAWTAAGPVSASAALLSAMQRDLGLTEKQALTRLA